MSALLFFVRPKLYCARCGGVCEQEINGERPSERTVWCATQACPQFFRRARFVDQGMVQMERPSDFVVEADGNH